MLTILAISFGVIQPWSGRLVDPNSQLIFKLRVLVSFPAVKPPSGSVVASTTAAAAGSSSAASARPTRSPCRQNSSTTRSGYATAATRRILPTPATRNTTATTTAPLHPMKSMLESATTQNLLTLNRRVIEIGRLMMIDFYLVEKKSLGWSIFKTIRTPMKANKRFSIILSRSCCADLSIADFPNTTFSILFSPFYNI